MFLLFDWYKAKAIAANIIPKNPIIESKNYSVSDFTISSLFGVHEAGNNPNNFNFGNDL